MKFQTMFVPVIIALVIESGVLGAFSIYQSNSSPKKDNITSGSIQQAEQRHANLSHSSSFLPTDSIPQTRDLPFPEPYFCGQIIGGHFMYGSESSYCGGYSVRDCSALCFYRNFTFFQCEGFVCHCYTR